MNTEVKCKAGDGDQIILSAWSITAGGGQIVTNKHKSNQYNEEGF